MSSSLPPSSDDSSVPSPPRPPSVRIDLSAATAPRRTEPIPVVAPAPAPPPTAALPPRPHAGWPVALGWSLIGAVTVCIFLQLFLLVQMNFLRRPEPPLAATPVPPPAAPVPTPAPEPTPPPAPVAAPAPALAPTKPRRTAPEGIYFLMRRYGAMTDSGVHELLPGSQVQVTDKSGEEWTVTDGEAILRVPPSDLINDLDLARRLFNAEYRPFPTPPPAPEKEMTPAPAPAETSPPRPARPPGSGLPPPMLSPLPPESSAAPDSPPATEESAPVVPPPDAPSAADPQPVGAPSLPAVAPSSPPP